MKQLWKSRTVLLALLTALFVGGARSEARAEVSVSVSFGGFYDQLAPYGSWVDVSSYGQCWRPGRVDAGWQPYADGEWIYSDYGWTWVSSDPWGDTPYHYGTWYFDPRYGWVWVPGTVWAPAWVTWCFADDFVGWAPLPPTVAFGASGYAGAPVVVSATRYVFVPTNRFVGVRVSGVRIPSAQYPTLLRRGTSITRFDVSGGIVRTNGPDPRRIESVTHTTIRRSSLSAVKSRPTPINAGGSSRGSAIALVSPAGAKDPEIKARISRGRPGASLGESTTKVHETKVHQTRVPETKAHEAKVHERNSGSVERHDSSPPPPVLHENVEPHTPNHPQESKGLHPAPPPPPMQGTPHEEHHTQARGPLPNQGHPAADNSSHGKGPSKPVKQDKPKKDSDKE